MKYTKKLPSVDKELSKHLNADGWIRIKEPKNIITAILVSLPIAFIITIVILLLGYLLNPSLFEFLQMDSLEFNIRIDLFSVFYIMGIFVFMLLHEFIHAIFIPNFIKSKKVYWGINCGFGFVFTTEPIKKWRFILISIMPFALLSGVLLFISALLGLLNGYVLFLCTLNAAGSCIDFLNILLIVFQVPNNSIIINNSFETYYIRTK